MAEHMLRCLNWGKSCSESENFELKLRFLDSARQNALKEYDLDQIRFALSLTTKFQDYCSLKAHTLENFQIALNLAMIILIQTVFMR